MSHRAEPSNDPRDSVSRGPWFLMAEGVWGSGRRSRVQVDDVFIVDLGTPPGEDDAPISNGFFVSEIEEDVTPSAEGLDLRLGAQMIKHLDDGLSVVRDVD